jgi:hypothetical protein
VVEDQLVVLVTVNELVVEFSIEDRVDSRGGFGCGGEDGGEGDGVGFLLFALFFEAFRGEDFGVGIGFVPVTNKDMVLCALSVLGTVKGCRVLRSYL